jgi:hypothetical protein
MIVSRSVNKALQWIWTRVITRSSQGPRGSFMFAFKAGLAAAAACVLVASVPAQAADLDMAYNDPSCMTAADYAGLSGSGLASAVGADVAANPSCAQDACNIASGIAASPVSSSATSKAIITPVASGARAIGAGLAQAYSQFVGAGDAEAAGSVADAGCGCGGGVSGAFVGSVGSQACSVYNGSETTYGGMGTVGSLFYIRAAGGGGGSPQSQN